uniref:Uncharacterized protein n=1 Tax=Solanum lycopersicum TaxID=4081 RepID=A0A3Q7HHM0_SOLLC
MCISCRRPRLDCFTPVMVVYILQKASSGLFYACYGYSNKATVPPFNSVKSFSGLLSIR